MRISLNYKETMTKGRLICLMRAEPREEYAVKEGLFMKWPGWHHKFILKDCAFRAASMRRSQANMRPEELLLVQEA